MIDFVILCCYLSDKQCLLSDGHLPEPKLTDVYPCLSEACISVKFSASPGAPFSGEAKSKQTMVSCRRVPFES